MKAALPALRTAQSREKCRCALTVFRLLLAACKKASLEDSIPLAQSMLTNTACDPFQVLQTVGSFAVYCEERGDARTGAALLQAALDRVNWEAVTVKLKSEARVTYEGLLARLQRAE